VRTSGRRVQCAACGHKWRVIPGSDTTPDTDVQDASPRPTAPLSQAVKPAPGIGLGLTVPPEPAVELPAPRPASSGVDGGAAMAPDPVAAGPTAEEALYRAPRQAPADEAREVAEEIQPNPDLALYRAPSPIRAALAPEGGGSEPNAPPAMSIIGPAARRPEASTDIEPQPGLAGERQRRFGGVAPENPGDAAPMFPPPTARPRRQRRPSSTPLTVLLVLLLLLAMLGSAAVAFRSEIATYVPGAADIYAQFGMGAPSKPAAAPHV